MARSRLGTGSGDKFEAFPGGSGLVEESVREAEDPAELQEKRTGKRR
jgi:hypothetical protein